MPPLMLTPGGPAVPPWVIPSPPPAPLVVPGMPSEEPRTTPEGPGGPPGRDPSGEIVNCAARFPGGTAITGVGSAGEVESAIRRRRPASPLTPASAGGPISGAGPTSAAGCRSPARGTEAGAIASRGRGLTTALEAIFSGPGRCSKLGTAGIGRSAVGLLAPVLGRSLTGLICRRGLAGRGGSDHCTICGNCGRIFGGSGGVSGWMSVWRGCVGRAGAEIIVCRGWKASAPRGDTAFLGSPRRRGLERGAAGGVSGGSVSAGAYQVTSIRGIRRRCLGSDWCHMGTGKLNKAICQRIEAARVRLRKEGGRTQESRKYPATGHAFGALGPPKTARRLLRKACHLDSQATWSRGTRKVSCIRRYFV